MPPHGVSVAPTSLGLDAEVGVVYDGSGKLRSPHRSPPATSAAPRVSPPSIPPPPKLKLQSSILPGDRMPPSNAAVDINSTPASSVELDDLTHGRDANKISSSSPKETLEVGPHSPNPILALRHDDVHLSTGGDGIVDDDDDDDADRFLDQFMEHYDRLDREEDLRDDASRQDQEEPSQEEDNDVMVPLGEVDKRLIVDEDEMQMQPPRQPWASISLLAAATAPEIPLVDTASVSSSETLATSSTLIAFPRNSSPILATDDSSPLDSYSYSYPYSSPRQNGEMGLELKSSSVSVPSATDSTSPASATWSTSESASVSRSRSFSSTYTSLSFGSESETSSCPQSSVDGDDDLGRYSNGIQHPLPQAQPPMLAKSATNSVLHAAEVSVLGSPPALSRPFGGNEDIGYIVSVPGPGFLISKSLVHRDLPLSSNMELSTRDDDADSTRTTTHLTYHDDEGDSNVHVEDRAGEGAGEGFDPHQESQHIAVSKSWMGGGVVMGQSEGRKDVEVEILSHKHEGITRKKHDPAATEVKTTVKGEAEVEWEYVIGDKPFAASNGRLNAAFNGHGIGGGRPPIAIVTPDAVSSGVPINDDTKLKTTSQRSPPTPISAMSLATPAMTLSTTHALMKDDLTCGSSTAVAAALAMSSWKQDTSSIHKSDRSVSHADDGHDDEKRRKRSGVLEKGGRRDLSSFLAISSSESSSSSSNDDDDDHYGPVNSSSPSQSQAVVNLRTQLSRTPSISTVPSGHMSPRPRIPAVSRKNGSRFSESESESESEEDEEEEEEDNDKNDEDDDVPLAKRIPGALTAQKSIRRQVRQEREKKKQEKALRVHAETTRTRLMTLRPGAVPSSSHDTAAAALVASQTTTHRSSRTLTRNGSRTLNPYSAEDLVRKRDMNGSDGVEIVTTTTPVDATSLYQQQALHSRNRSKSVTRSLRDVRPSSATEPVPPVPILQSRPPSSQSQRSKSVKEPSSLPYHYPTSPSPTPINSSYAPSSMTPLRPKRSFHFHRPSIDRRPIGMDDPRSVPLPSDAEKRISGNVTHVIRSRPSTREGPQQHATTFTTATPITQHHRSLSRSRSSIDHASTTTMSEPAPPIPIAKISHGEYHNFVQSQISRAGSNRNSADVDKHSRAPSRQHRVPAPPVSSASASSPADPLPMISSKPELVVQQRVFIGNMQRFNMVEIGASTTAGDIVEMIEAEGSFKDFVGSGGWMVFEVAQDFGMGTLFFFYPFLQRYVSICFNFVFFFFSRTPHKEL